MTDFDPEFRSLQSALAELHDPHIAVPGEMDEAILSAARRLFHLRGRRWSIIRRTGVGLAAAAALALAIRLYVPNSQAPSAPKQLAQAADINRDGRVNILDAYTVARHIALGQPLDPAWDINGDGVVDQKDVDLIGTLAVHVSGEKPQ